MYTNVTTNAQGGGGGNSPVHQQQNQRESIQRLRSQHCGKSEQLFILWYREELKKLGRPLPKIGDFGKECASKWNQMSKKEKVPFLHKSEDEEEEEEVEEEDDDDDEEEDEDEEEEDEEESDHDNERFHKMIKCFSMCSKDTNHYVNNEAVVHFLIGKPNTAVHFLSKNLTLLTPESLYNYGLMNLFTGNTKNAFEVFIRLTEPYKHNPRLWLRLAECKLEELRKDRIDNFDNSGQNHELPWSYTDQGGNRKLIFNANTDKYESSKSDLLVVRECLLNSHMLLKPDGRAEYSPNNNNLSEFELKKLKFSVLLNLSYVNLCLCEYHSAYENASEGLSLLPEGSQKALFHLYAGEASVWMDKISEAIVHFSSHLHLNNNGTTTTTTPSTGHISSTGNGNQNSDITTGKILLCYNLSVSHALKCDFSKASETVRLMGNLRSSTQAGSSQPLLPIKVIYLALYIQLAQGNVDGAISIIKQHLPHYR